MIWYRDEEQLEEQPEGQTSETILDVVVFLISGAELEGSNYPDLPKAGHVVRGPYVSEMGPSR